MTVNAFMRVLIMCCLFCSMCSPAAKAGPQSIKVVMGNNYPPFRFKDSVGKQQCILIGQWRLYQKKAGNLELARDSHPQEAFLERSDYVAQN